MTGMALSDGTPLPDYSAYQRETAKMRALMLDGSWSSQPLPRWWHRCTVAQLGFIGHMRVERCACGGMRLDGGFWSGRNSRRS